jgi:sarcosine oxidase subunit beta
VVKDLVVENKMYFRPATGGVVLVGTGDHGDPVDDADALDENVSTDFIELQGGQVARRMPSFADAAVTDSWVGAYDITPDWNPVLGPSEGVDGLHIAYGFSGHGFKMAPAVGRMLAKTVLGETPEIDITPYRLGRFADGAMLTGAYGVGSIS